MWRIHTVARRTAQCLFAYEFGKRLPITHSVNAASLESLSTFEQHRLDEFNKEILIPLFEQPLKIACGNQFAYSFIKTEEPLSCVWILSLLWYSTALCLYVGTTKQSGNPVMTESESQKAPDSSNWVILISLILGFGGCIVLSERAHQNYLNKTTPEQRAIDREQMQREDDRDDNQYNSYRGR